MDVYLGDGSLVVCSPEDHEIVAGERWRAWALKGKTRAVRDVMAKLSRYRIHLHREIGFRMHPDLVKTPARMVVQPINGDFMDVRRENLAITVKPRTRGGARRPAGHRVAEFTGTGPHRPKSPPAWARSAKPTDEALHGD